MVRCPACGSLLFRRRIGGVEVDGCPGCGGSFFDGGELKELLAHPDSLREVERHFVPGLTPAAAPARTDACPRCASPMIRYTPPSLGGALEVEGCRSCGGIWLDHGEPGAIAARLAPVAAPVEAPAAAPAASPTAARIAAVVGRAPASAAAPALAVPFPAAPADPTRTAGLPVVRGRRLAAPVEGGGLLAGLSRAFRFFGTAFSLAAECPRLLVPLLGGALLQAAVLSALVFWLFTVLGRPGAAASVAFVGEEQVALWLSAHALVLPLALVLVGFVGHLINLAVLGTTVSMIDAYLKGREPTFGVAVRDVGKNLAAVVALAAIGTLVDLVTGMIRNAGNGRGVGGLFLRPLAHALAGLIETAWTVLGFLLLPVIVIEDVGLRPALERVRAIHRGSLLPIAVGEVGLRTLSAIGGLLFFGGLVLLGLALWPLSTGELRGLLIFALGLGAAGGALFAYLRGAYYTCLYLWAAETERAGDPALATVPAPLADALAR